MPEKEDYENGYSDEESYDMLDEHSLTIKQEDFNNDDYSIYSDYDRKLPAQVHHSPSNITIKQESDTESVSQMSARCLTQNETIPYSTPVDQEELPDGESNIAIKEEDIEMEFEPSNRKAKSAKKVRRRLIYDEVSYFDSIDDNKDDPDEDSFDQGSSSRMPRGFNGPRTRDHYHIRTRFSKKRTRSERKGRSYRHRNARARKGLALQKKRQRGNGRQLQRKYKMKWSHPCSNFRSNNQWKDDRVSVSNYAEIGATMQNGIKSRFDVERLMKAWRIDKETALKTIRATTQRYKRKQDPKMTRNSPTGDKATRYNRINDHLFMDTMFATSKGGKSVRGNTCAQIFTTDRGFIAAYPMQSKSQVKQAIRLFCKEIGVPSVFIGDQSGEQTSNDVRQYIKSVGSSLRLLEEGTPWANRAELIIGHLKAAVRKDLVTSKCPICLWDYCLERRVRINNLTAKGMLTLKGETPYTTVYGKEGDISALADFSWYEVVYYMDQKQPFPYAKEVLGRYLGPSTGVGNEYCSWILRSNGKIVARRTVRPLTHIEQSSTVVSESIRLFDSKMTDKFGDGINGPKDFAPDQPLEFLGFDDFEDDIQFTKGQRSVQQPILNGLLVRVGPNYISLKR